jgi:hypothetical protein
VAYSEFVPVFAEKNTYPFAYIRANGTERLLIVLNPANRDVSASFTLKYECKKPKLISGDGTITRKGNVISVKMNPVRYAIFRVDEVQ